MSELWLTYQTADGERRVAIDRPVFTVGRHSANDLSISDGRLSREHIRIETIGDTFIVTDLGSSNGTRLNGIGLLAKEPLSNGDELDLGGLLCRVEINGAVLPLPVAEPDDASVPAANETSPIAAAPVVSAAGGEKKRSGVRMLALVLIPMFAIVILLCAGVLIYVAMSRGGPDPTGKDIVIDQTDETDEPPDDDSPAKTPRAVTAQPPGTGPTTGPGGNTIDPGGTPLPPSETAATEEAGAKFLRRIAQNDPKAFLTLEQAKRVDDRVKQFKGSTGLANNIGAARKNSQEIAELAGSNSLRPQMLAVAAIARLGGTRGDVVAAARSIAPVLAKLAPHIGNERADDALLMIAAFDQGAAGDTMKLRNMLQEMATKNPESSREIRSIWFLEKESRITRNEFDRALTFLAVGAITQNPKAFGVNAEALEL